MTPRRAGLWCVLLFEAGLATGLSHFWGPACVILLLAAIGAAHAGLRFALLAMLIGTGVGRAGQLANGESCAARMPAGRVQLTVRLHEPGSTSGLVAVRPVHAGCRGLIAMRVTGADSLPAGRVLRVVGTWRPRTGPLQHAEGILVAARFESLADAPGVGERLRTRVARASRQLYGPRAALVEALVLGSRGALDPGLKQDFAASGLVHLLSISGFHVGLIVAWVVLGAGLAGLDRCRALWLGALIGVLYAGFLGWPAPATRAAFLCGLGALQLQRQRHASLGALVSVTCVLVTLVDPWAIVSVGAWLSVLALAGADWAARWCGRAVSERSAVRLLASSVGATVATAPVTAAVFGTVPIIGIALNLAAIPLAAIAVPGVVASLALAPVLPALAGALAAGAGLGLHGLELLARIGAQVPFGCLVVSPTVSSALIWGGVLFTGRWMAGRYVTAPVALRRGALAVLAASWIGAAAATPWHGGDDTGALTLHFLDVGQGDGAAIRTPGGHWVLVDAGPRSGATDAGRSVVAPFLVRERVRRLDVVVISHAHADHVGGAAAVLDRFPAGLVLEPGELVADPVYGDFLSAVAADGAEWRPARKGMRFEVDSVRFTLVHPDTALVDWGLDLNEDSAMLLVEYRGFRALLAGDAGLVTEASLAGAIGAVDLLKVGHHGSRTATGDAWLGELAPAVGIVSVGANRYGHPSPEALARLVRHRVAVWRTDRDGAITVSTDGHRMRVRGTTRAADYALHPEEPGP